MMVECAKNKLFSVVMCILVLCISLPLTGCQNKQNLINTHRMPGHKMSELLKATIPDNSTNSSSKGPLTRTKSGVYIYKDNSVTNTSGYKFQIKERTNLGPTDVRFDAEHFRTRY